MEYAKNCPSGGKAKGEKVSIKHNFSLSLVPDCLPQPLQFQQPDPDPCVPPFITPGTSGCYYVPTVSTDYFTRAKSLCSDQGGRLVEIDSQKKQDEITPYLAADPATSGLTYFWMGATDEAVEGSWVWTTSGRPVTFSNWRPGQPGGGLAEGCTLFNLTANGLWQDNVCVQPSSYGKRKAICEIGENS